MKIVCAEGTKNKKKKEEEEEEEGGGNEVGKGTWVPGIAGEGESEEEESWFRFVPTPTAAANGKRKPGGVALPISKSSMSSIPSPSAPLLQTKRFILTLLCSPYKTYFHFYFFLFSYGSFLLYQS